MRISKYEPCSGLERCVSKGTGEQQRAAGEECRSGQWRVKQQSSPDGTCEQPLGIGSIGAFSSLHKFCHRKQLASGAPSSARRAPLPRPPASLALRPWRAHSLPARQARLQGSGAGINHASVWGNQVMGGSDSSSRGGEAARAAAAAGVVAMAPADSTRGADRARAAAAVQRELLAACLHCGQPPAFRIKTERPEQATHGLFTHEGSPSLSLLCLPAFEAPRWAAGRQPGP